MFVMHGVLSDRPGFCAHTSALLRRGCQVLGVQLNLGGVRRLQGLALLLGDLGAVGLVRRDALRVVLRKLAGVLARCKQVGRRRLALFKLFPLLRLQLGPLLLLALQPLRLGLAIANCRLDGARVRRVRACLCHRTWSFS